MDRNKRWGFPFVIAAIIAIIVGIVVFNGTLAIEFLTTPIEFATIFAGISLILLFIGATFAVKKEARRKIEEYGIIIALGAIGTLITGFLGLTFLTILVAGSLLTALLIVFGVFFFILNFISLICLIIELLNGIYYEKDDFCNYENR